VKQPDQKVLTQSTQKPGITGSVVSTIYDFGLLIKFRLTLTVVFSAIVAYLAASHGNHIDGNMLLILTMGGFCITSAANALNEVLEKDYDKLMKRTANRPLAAGRWTTSQGVIISGLMFVCGIFLLSLFNPICAVLGSMAVVTYAFIYTPVKRFSPLSVLIGAFPGALPTMIGCVAAEGTVTSLAWVIFGIQFLWQFPHFWSIGWLAAKEYDQAGYKLIPMNGDAPHKSIGFQSFIFASFLIPFTILPYYLGMMSLPSMIVAVVMSILYTFFGWNLYKQKTRKAALMLMFYSFLYLPVVLIGFWVGGN